MGRHFKVAKYRVLLFLFYLFLIIVSQYTFFLLFVVVCFAALLILKTKTEWFHYVALCVCLSSLSRLLLELFTLVFEYCNLLKMTFMSKTFLLKFD